MSLLVERNQKYWQYTSTWKRRHFYCSIWEMCGLIRKYKLDKCYAIWRLSNWKRNPFNMYYKLDHSSLVFQVMRIFLSLGIHPVKGYTLERIVTAGLIMPWFSVSTLKQFIFCSIYITVNPVTTLLPENKSMLSDTKRRKQKLEHSFLVSSRACLPYVGFSPGILLWYTWATQTYKIIKQKEAESCFGGSHVHNSQCLQKKNPWYYFPYADICCFIDCKWLWI